MAVFTAFAIISFPFWVIYLCLKIVRTLLSNPVLIAALFFGLALFMMGAASIMVSPLEPRRSSAYFEDTLENWNAPVIELEDTFLGKDSDRQSDKLSTNKTDEIDNGDEENWNAPVIEIEDTFLNENSNRQSEKLKIPNTTEEFDNGEDVTSRQCDPLNDTITSDLPDDTKSSVSE